MKLLLTLSILFPIQSLFGQVEHNFTMGPLNTTCDSLKTQDLTTVGLIEKVRNTTFRYHEQMKISRSKTPRQVWFYSCDGKTGYLIARETDDRELIYRNITMKAWNELLNARDPILAYKKMQQSIE